MSAKNSPTIMDVLHHIWRVIENGTARDTAADFNTDTKLAWLTGRVGNIVLTTRRQDAVLSVAACAVAWLQSLKMGYTDIAYQIANERARQLDMYVLRKHLFRMDSPDVDWTRKLRVLVEEVGELAAAIDQLEARPQNKAAKRNFTTELVQVAAVSVAWLQSFEEGK